MMHIISCKISFLFTSVSIHLFKKKSTLGFTIDGSEQLLIILFKLINHLRKALRKSTRLNRWVLIITSTHFIGSILLLLVNWILIHQNKNILLYSYVINSYIHDEFEISKFRLIGILSNISHGPFIERIIMKN